MTYLIVMGVLIAVIMFVGFRGGMPMIEMLKAFAILGGFMTVVMIAVYLLTKLFLKLIFLWMKLMLKITSAYMGTNEKNSSEEDQDEAESGKAAGDLITYRYKVDEEKIHSWSAVETKGGRHIRYRSVRKLTRCREENWIAVYAGLEKTLIYVAEEDFETVWNFITDRCTRANIVGEV